MKSNLVEQIKKQSQNLNQDDSYDSSHCILKIFLLLWQFICLYLPRYCIETAIMIVLWF